MMDVQPLTLDVNAWPSEKKRSTVSPDNYHKIWELDEYLKNIGFGR